MEVEPLNIQFSHKRTSSQPVDFSRSGSIPVLDHVSEDDITERAVLPQLGLIYRVFERGVSIFFAVFAAPLCITVALVALVLNGRPVFFAQKRIGMRGQPFTIYKFRTMIKNAEALKDSLSHLNVMSGPFFKILNDPRVTKLGAFLRASSLDELPQLLNCLMGDMSLVGPRPMLPTEVERLDCKDILVVRPGLTGLWQVSGRNRITDFRQKLRLDREYISNKSIRTDLIIILKTIKSVFYRTGAY